jgi:hypothetical protein
MDVVEEVEFANVVADMVEPRRAAAGAVAGGGGRRSVPPFSRSLVAQDAVTCDESGNRRPPLPPTPHLVGVRVKGALAGRANGAERVPAHMRLRAQPPPPIVLFLCFAERSEALQFISKVLAYKKYQLTVAVHMQVTSLAAVSRRETLRRGHKLFEDSPIARRMPSQDAASSVEPPPLPPRPSNLPPPNKLPQMVTNDEGEVFWYVPKKPQAPGSEASGSGPSQPGATGSSPVNSSNKSIGPAPQPSPFPGPGHGFGPGPGQGFGPGLGPRGGPGQGLLFGDRQPQPLAPPCDDPLPDMSARTCSEALAAVLPQTPRPPGGAVVAAAAVELAMGSHSPVPSKSLPPPLALERPASLRTPGSHRPAFDNGFEEADGLEFGALDTPAPCLAAPKPFPGRPQRI